MEIDALLVVYPDSDDSEVDDAEEDTDDVQWVGTGSCESCNSEDVELCVWAGITICSDCLEMDQSDSLST